MAKKLFSNQLTSKTIKIGRTNSDLWGESRFTKLFIVEHVASGKIYIGLETNKGQVYRTRKDYKNLNTALGYVSTGTWAHITWDKRTKKNNITLDWITG